MKDIIDNWSWHLSIIRSWSDHIEEIIIAHDKYGFIIPHDIFQYICCPDTLLDANFGRQMWIDDKLQSDILIYWFWLIKVIIHVVRHHDRESNRSHTKGELEEWGLPINW